jgi:phospholipid/cholesterol/gamma-HCH transport system ATP-binding protein
MSVDETSDLAIQVRGLVTHYGERMILKGIDFDVRGSEIMVIMVIMVTMGGSGSGKSTLMRHLLALEAATSGSVEVLGQDIARLGTRARAELSKNIGVAFQSGALFSSLSVGENIQLPLAEHTKLDAATMEIMTRMKL